MFKINVKNGETKISVALESSEQPGKELMEAFLESPAVQNIMRPKDAWADSYLSELDKLCPKAPAAPSIQKPLLKTSTPVSVVSPKPVFTTKDEDDNDTVTSPFAKLANISVEEDSPGWRRTDRGDKIYRVLYECECGERGSRFSLSTNTYCKCHACNKPMNITWFNPLKPGQTDMKPLSSEVQVYGFAGKKTREGAIQVANEHFKN